MKIKIVALLFICFGLVACQKKDDALYLPSVNAERLSYLQQYTGIYEGTSDHAYSHPSCPGYTCYVTDHVTKNVVVAVELGTLDSCINLRIVYNNATTENMNNLKVSASGRHYSSWFEAGGSGHLNISFKSDTLVYNEYESGHVTSSSINFNAIKNNLYKN